MFPIMKTNQKYLRITTYYPNKTILTISNDNECSTDYGGSGEFVESIALVKIKKLISGKTKRIIQKA
jgi:hypothetical protein